ncbi:hypothetical protein BRARA_I01874 [Brassica rapa]|uniref:SWIM-type domain-containing protein n=1 Tax=Brassica campestris TaxID=3711 RepID=A0A397Y3E8_BRACM|nr:hypothetical protein BRARA_I01874 [Brassica rapa]
MYAFTSLKACIDGWHHLRKVLVVDGTHMFWKYKGILLSASGQDADCRVFHIAFAVVDSENSDSWKWFSERCAAIFAAKDKMRNVDYKYKGMNQKQMVPRAAEAFKVSEFQKIYDLIKLTDWRCWDYLEKIDKKLWIRSHFEEIRFNLMTSNIAGSLNKALLRARDSSIMALLEFIRRMLTRWFECRRYDISKRQGNIPKIINEIVVEHLVLSTGLLVLPCSTWQFEVTHKPTKYSFVVDLEKRTCSCLEFQMLGLPCRHAIAAASFRKMEYALFVSQYHVKDTWSETVKGIILPIPNPEDINIS